MISQKKLIYSREYHRALKTLVNQGMEKEEAKGCARTKAQESTKGLRSPS